MPDEVTFNQRVVRVVKGDLTALEGDAMVMYAQSNLSLGTGFGGAVSVRGGPAIQEELKAIGSIGPAEAVATSAGDLKYKHIVHANGPRFLEEDMEGKLRRTIHNALNQAEACDARSVVIPPLGAGFHGVPLDMCCRVMIESIKSRLSGETKLREITICALDNREYAPFQQALRQQFGKGN